MADICRECIKKGNPGNEGVWMDFGTDNRYLIKASHIDKHGGADIVYFFGSRNAAGDNGKAPGQPVGDLSDPGHFYELCGMSRNGVYIWDVTQAQRFVLRYANPAYEKIAKLKAETAYGKSLEEIVPMKMLDQIQSWFAECVAIKKDVEFVQKYSERVLVTKLSPRLEGNRVTRIFGTHTDITEFLSEQEELRIANERLKYYDNIIREQLCFEELIAKSLRDFWTPDKPGSTTVYIVLSGSLAGRWISTTSAS